MTFSITEASAINSVLDYFLHRSPDGRRQVSEREAFDAAKLLAKHANKRLMAGIREIDVAADWATPNRLMALAAQATGAKLEADQRVSNWARTYAPDARECAEGHPFRSDDDAVMPDGWDHFLCKQCVAEAALS